MDTWQERVTFRVWMLGLPNRLSPCEIQRLMFLLWMIHTGRLADDGPTYALRAPSVPTAAH